MPAFSFNHTPFPAAAGNHGACAFSLPASNPPAAATTQFRPFVAILASFNTGRSFRWIVRPSEVDSYFEKLHVSSSL